MFDLIYRFSFLILSESVQRLIFSGSVCNWTQMQLKQLDLTNVYNAKTKIFMTKILDIHWNLVHVNDFPKGVIIVGIGFDNFQIFI